jgi:hypothetical protein
MAMNDLDPDSRISMDLPTEGRHPSLMAAPHQNSNLTLKSRIAGGGIVEEASRGAWHLSLPAGDGKIYRWAQLDDTMGLPRADLLWKPPLRFHLRACLSAADPSGTWGFGLWNDPFSAGIGLSGMSRRLPALPNAAWFFFASPPNYLSLRDDLPADRLLAATFRSAQLPAAPLVLAALGLPLLTIPPAARLLRRLARRFVNQSATHLDLDATGWHDYEVAWRVESTEFFVDGASVHRTPISPIGPLGLVLWIDNQYAAFTPQGRLSFGNLPQAMPVTLEVCDVQME